VTEAVHAKGGIIFLQLWHCGRLSHRLNQRGGEQPVSASAVPNVDGKVKIMTDEGVVPIETPRELRLDEIPGIIEAYCQAARNALEVGFDGVEIHAV
jgi:N-ethylmaleimide reductase